MAWPRPLAPVLAAAAMALAVPPVASGADDPGVVPFQVEVGQSKPLSGGPIRQLICDDPALVEPAFTPSAVVLTGKKPGTTLCSYFDVASVRTVLRVTVVPASTGRGH